MALPLNIALQQQPLKDNNGNPVGPRGPVHLDPLHCELLYAIENGLTVRQFVARHARLYQFQETLTKLLVGTRFEHELAHLILGLAFMKLQRNPTPYDFGYNGNLHAEAWVTNFESFLNPDYLSISDNEDKFCDRVQLSFDDGISREKQKIYDALNRVASHAEAPLSLFEARHSSRGLFEDADAQRISSNTRNTQWGETAPHLTPPSDEVTRAIYRIVQPLAVKIRTLMHQACSSDRIVTDDGRLGIDRAAAYDFYQNMRVSDLWEYMEGRNPAEEKLGSILTSLDQYAKVSGHNSNSFNEYFLEKALELTTQNNRRPDEWTKFLAFDEPVIAARFAALRAAYNQKNPYLTAHSSGWNKLLRTKIDRYYFSAGGKGLEAALDQQIVALGGVIPPAATQISTVEAIHAGNVAGNHGPKVWVQAGA